MGVDVFGHTLSFMPDNFLDESLVNFLFGEERDAGVSCIMRAVSVIDRLHYKETIIELVGKIQSEKVLKRIYKFVLYLYTHETGS